MEPPAYTHNMASFTIKQIPKPLLERLRQRAQSNRRSLAKELLLMLEAALDVPEGGPPAAARESSARYDAAGDGVDEGMDREAQVAAWRELCGQWRSDQTLDEELEAIYAVRTAGREVEL